MNKIEKNLKIAKIIGGEDWVNAVITGPKKAINPQKFNEPYVSEKRIVGKNGILLDSDCWISQVEIKEKPEKFVISTCNLPKEFLCRYLLKGDTQDISLALKPYDWNGYLGIDSKRGVTFASKSLVDFEGYRLITLDQWKQLFNKDIPKVGDWGIFWDSNREVGSIIGELKDIHTKKTYPYKSSAGIPYKHFEKFDLNKPLKDLIEND